MKTIIFFLSFCLLTSMTAPLHAGAWIGYPAPSFKAQDILTNKEISLSDFAGKVVVLEWLAPNCPFVQKQYARVMENNQGRIPLMQAKFAAAPFNVVWISIDSSFSKEGIPLSASQWKDWLQVQSAKPSVFIIDTKKEIAKLFKVTCIPQFFVIDEEGSLVYKGSMDSIRSTDPADILRSANRNYLEAALIQLTEGKHVFTQETIPYGCSLEL
jgi:thiol-disulfide isomerase/thioredoxin